MEGTKTINYGVISDAAYEIQYLTDWLNKCNNIEKNIIIQDIEDIELSIKYLDKVEYAKKIAKIDTDTELSDWFKVTAKAKAYDDSIVSIKEKLKDKTIIKVLEIIKEQVKEDIAYYEQKIKVHYDNSKV